MKMPASCLVFFGRFPLVSVGKLWWAGQTARTTLLSRLACVRRPERVQDTGRQINAARWVKCGQQKIGVEFRYRPGSFYAGLSVTSSGNCLWNCGCFCGRLMQLVSVTRAESDNRRNG